MYALLGRIVVGAFVIILVVPFLGGLFAGVWLPVFFPDAAATPALPSEPATPPARQAFLNARIIPVTAPDIPSGFILVENGRIIDLGPMTAWDPAGPPAEEYDCVGQTIMPGLVCTHSHIGIRGRGGGGGDRSHPIQPDVRILDSINVEDPGFRRAVAGGLTCLNIMPGSGHLSSGPTRALAS